MTGRAELLIRALYAYMALMAALQLGAPVSAIDVASDLPFYLRWIGEDPEPRLRALALILTFSAAAAAARPRWTAARFAAAASLWAYAGGRYYLTHWGHVWHVWAVCAALLVLLPRAGERDADQSTLLVLRACQASLALTYGLAGLSKLAAASWQAWHGQIHAFSPEALAYVTAGRWFESGVLTPLGRWLIEHPAAGWLPYAMVILLEICAPASALTPRLHRLWGVAFGGLHLGIWLLLGVSFRDHAALALLLFCGSPFPDAWRVRGTMDRIRA